MSRLAAGFCWFPFFLRCARFSTGRVCTEGRYVILSVFPRSVNRWYGDGSGARGPGAGRPAGRPRTGHPSASEGKRTGGRVLPVGSTTPVRAVRAPSVSEGWTRRVQGCRLCRPRGPRSGPRVSPPYALARFSSIFYISCRKHRFAGATAIFRRAATPHSPWATNGPRGPHTPGTVAALRVAWPIATVAHRTRGPWFTTALLAPLGSQQHRISPGHPRSIPVETCDDTSGVLVFDSVTRSHRTQSRCIYQRKYL